MVSVTIRTEGGEYIWREDANAYTFYDRFQLAVHFFGEQPNGRHFISDDLAYTLFPEATH